MDQQEAEQGPGTGENKRHQVYARLLKEFPTLPRRAAALAIEQVRWGVVLPEDREGELMLADLRDDVDRLTRQCQEATRGRTEAERVADEAMARARAAQREILGQIIKEEVEMGLSEIHGLRLNELGRGRVSDAAIQGLDRAAGVLKRLLAHVEAS